MELAISFIAATGNADMKQARDAMSLVKEALDQNAHVYVEAQREIAVAESERAARLWKYVQKGRYPTQKDADGLVNIVADYISGITTCNSHLQYPDFDHLEVYVEEAKVLLEFIKNVQGSHEAQISKCSEGIRKLQQLDFSFDYQGYLRERSFEEGQVVELPVLTSLEIRLGPPERSPYDESVFVRLGQKEPDTRLFEIELAPPSGSGFAVSLYECHHNQDKRTKLREFAWDDFWIYRDHINDKAAIGDSYSIYLANQAGNHFSVYSAWEVTGSAKVTIGNVGSDLGVFVQRSKKTDPGETRPAGTGFEFP